MVSESADMVSSSRIRPAVTARERTGIVWPEAERRPWSPPRLRVLGELRSVTMGPSPGIGESGTPVAFRP